MTQKQTELCLIRMSEVETQEVRWLWRPYIPFGKITIIQGNPGEGKTTLALRLAAVCSRGQAVGQRHQLLPAVCGAGVPSGSNRPSQRKPCVVLPLHAVFLPG